MVRGMRGTAIRVEGGEVCQLEGEGGEERWPMVDLSYSHVIGNMGNRGSHQLQESAFVT